jgi:aldehyde dehydrogenase (NAD+)
VNDGLVLGTREARAAAGRRLGIPRQEAMRIAGARVTSERVIEVTNPWSGEVVGTVPCATREDVQRAVDAVAGYRPSLTRAERATILRRVAALLRARRDDVSDLVTLESGLAKKDTLHEVACTVDLFASAAEAVLEPVSPMRTVTPFNHPLGHVAQEVLRSIATNRCMVLTPSAKTPLSALLLASVLDEAGLPPAMVSVVTGDPDAIGGEMPAATAREPMIVTPHADLGDAAARAALGSYRNSGQRCTAIRPLLVLEAVADRFVDLLVQAARAVRYGDPMDPSTDLGTVIDEHAARAIETRVEEAIHGGARVLHGHRRRGALLAPTVLDRVPRDAALVREEIAGPIAPVLRVRDVNDAMALANDLPAPAVCRIVRSSCVICACP